MNVLGTVRILEAARRHGARSCSPRPAARSTANPSSLRARTHVRAALAVRHGEARRRGVHPLVQPSLRDAAYRAALRERLRARQDPHGEAGVVAIFLGRSHAASRRRSSATACRRATTSTSATSHGRRPRRSDRTAASSTSGPDARRPSSSCTSCAPRSPARTLPPSTRPRASASCSAASSIPSAPRTSSGSARWSTSRTVCARPGTGSRHREGLS